MLLGDAALVVFLIAGAGTPLATAGATASAVVLAELLAYRPGRIEDASAAHEARLRPWVDAA